MKSVVSRLSRSTSLHDVIICKEYRHSDAIIIVAGDFNSLETGFLESYFGLQQMVTPITHGSKIIDKIFVSHVDYFVCSTVKSIVKLSTWQYCYLMLLVPPINLMLQTGKKLKFTI